MLLLRTPSLASNSWAERAEKPFYNVCHANETTENFANQKNTSATWGVLPLPLSHGILNPLVSDTVPEALSAEGAEKIYS